MSPSTAVELPAPEIRPVMGMSGKWQREYDAFLRLRPQLVSTHLGKYVMIHEGQVVDSGDDDVALAMRFFAQHGNVPVHIGLVAEGPEPVSRLPHYREHTPGAAR